MAALIHTAQHPLAGQVCSLHLPKKLGLVNRDPDVKHVMYLQDADYTVEDWADRVGIAWQLSTDKWSTIYVLRLTWLGLPPNDEVVAGWVGIERFLAHVTELEFNGDLEELGDV